MDREETLSTEMSAPAEISDKSAAGERPYAFVFVCRDGSQPAGMTIDEAFLNALRSVDTQGETATRVCRGGILIAQLAYKPAAIAAQPPKTGSVTAGVSTTQRADMHLYSTLVGDFVESCLERWNTFEPSRFWEYVAKHPLDATIVTTLPARFAAPMDALLRAHPQYLGAVEPDLGNPLHRHLFVECMFKDAFVRSGQVFVQADGEGDYQGVFDGADTFSPAGMAVLPYEQFEGAAPSARLPPSLSARGLVSQMRWQHLTLRTVHEKVLAALDDNDALGNVTTPFIWDLNQLPNAVEQVEVHASKLTDYLLNPTHKVGKSKAIFFEKELAIVRADWAYLHAQLVDGLQSVLYEDVRLDQHGIRFTARLPVKGRNGATATIETGWIVRPGERASFVTAFPSRKSEALEQQATDPQVLPPELTGAARWPKLYQLADDAGVRAMHACVPKPMVVGNEVYMEGSCGGAFIVIDDGRRAFARWLSKQGIGHRHHHSGYSVSARQIGQSADTARAYADAFVRVLRRNGVECRAETYLD